MQVLGVWGSSDISIGEALLIALLAIAIVFLTLLVVIGATGAFQKGYEVVLKKTTVSPRPENHILEEDKDAVVAVLTATIDFHKETGKDCRVISITRED